MNTLALSALAAGWMMISACAVAQTQESPAATATDKTTSDSTPPKPPRPILSTSPAPVGMTEKEANKKNEILYSNIWQDSSGKTHIAQCLLHGLQLSGYAKPAAPYDLGYTPDQVKSIVYSVMPVGWYGAWHRAPARQWVIVLSGAWEVETNDGHTLRQGPGQFQFNADDRVMATSATGHAGHTARQVGKVPTARVIITLNKDPQQNDTNQACVL